MKCLFLEFRIASPLFNFFYKILCNTFITFHSWFLGLVIRLNETYVHTVGEEKRFFLFTEAVLLGLLGTFEIGSEGEPA